VNRQSHLDPLAIVLMTILSASWGVSQVAIKVANADISPLLQAGLRSAGAAILVLGWSALRGGRLFARDGSLGLGLLIGALFTAEFALIYVGMLFTTASRAVIFVYLAPFVVAIGAHLWIPGERLSGRQVAGLLCACTGVALAFAEGLRLPTHRELLGDAMATAGAVFWGATTLVIKGSRINQISPDKTLLYQLGVSAIVLLPLSWLLDGPGVAMPGALSLGALAFQTIWVAFVTYLVWFWLIAHYPAAKLSSFSFLTPLCGVLAGAALLGEPVTPLLVAAMSLVGVGIYLVNRVRRGTA
jgi:drug/metabolite transporter (DMT)-like permease